MSSRLAAFAAAFAVVGLSYAAPASAAPTPIDDPSAVGQLGFCDSTGHQVRGGSLAAAPFAWTTVSSVAAPAGYEKGKASVYAFQPRKNTSPGEWSGKQMAAASSFTSAKHPMSAGTQLDASLGDFTGTYPPQLDGLVQLRMIFTAPNRPQYVTDYPDVFIRVSGQRWNQVDGGTVDCGAGTARSVELEALSRARLTIKHPRPKPETAAQVVARSAAVASSTARPSGSTAAGGSGAPAPAAASSAAAEPVADRKADDGGTSVWIWIVVAGVVVLGGGTVLAARRSRASG